MEHGDKPVLKHPEKQKMLDELESLSRLLDDDPDDEPSRPIPDDIPVLKSFVDDVPVLMERLDMAPTPASASNTDAAVPPVSLPDIRSNGQLDVSFLDKNPLEISAAVRQHRTTPTTAPDTSATPVTPAPATAAPREPVPPLPAATITPPATAVTPPAPTSQTAPAPRATSAQQVTQPLSRFQSSKGENPFLPKSTLDKIRENHANDASSELRKLIENNPLNKLSFDLSPGSREYQQLRQKASLMVNEVIRANMPRLEAELRLRLEQEVDRMFRELKKK